MAKTEKSGRSVKVAPTWRDKVAELDVNNICEGRTCEIILMVELTISFSEAVNLFHQEAKKYATHVVKSINFENIIEDLKKYEPAKQKVQEDKGKGKGKSKPEPPSALFQAAVEETMVFLDKEENVPIELLAQLIKLTVINKIFQDVTLRDNERKLEQQRLLYNNEDGAVKKDKERGSKGRKESVVLPVEKRHLYFLLNGFYNPDLAFELFKIKMPLNAILELATPDSIFREKFQTEVTPKVSLSSLSESINIENNDEEDEDEIVLFVNPHYETSKDSLRVSTFVEEEDLMTDPFYSDVYNRIEILYNFWEKIYKQLEGELQAKFLENTIHVRIFPRSALQYGENQSLMVFNEIYNEIVNIVDARRQHLNYLKNLKILEIEDQTKKVVPIESLKVYNKLISGIPPDCFTVSYFMHCLIEEVCSRIPKQTKKSKTENSQSQMDIHKGTSSTIYNESKKDDDELGEIVLDLINYRKSYQPFCKTGIVYKPNDFIPNTPLKISKEHFEIYEDDWLSFKINSYKNLPRQFLKINFDYLKMSSTTFLWRLFPRLTTIEVIYKIYQLQAWSNILNLSVDDLKFVIATIEFDLLYCKEFITNGNQHRGTLQQLFPKKNNSEVLKVAQPHVRYMQTPDISVTTIVERRHCLKVPNIVYSNHPNIYEAKNIPAYLWYEKLSSLVFLQTIKRANSEYRCLDYKYSPYIDGILLRYHNNCDIFGINSKIWTQSLRTPICLRDFCKYIVHEDSKWLEYEEDNYQNKFRRKENIKEEKFQDRCSKPEEPYNFYGYDLGEARVQLTGVTTTFHSMDGYKIIVDRADFIGKPHKLSLNITMSNHSFLLHYNKVRTREPFMFHFCLEDGSVIVFTKPNHLDNSEILMAQKVIHKQVRRHNLNPRTAYKPRNENVYYLTEKHYCYLKNTKVPFIKTRSTILKEEYLMRFLERLSSLKCNTMENTENVRASLKGMSPKLQRNSKEVYTLYMSSKVKKNVKNKEGTGVSEQNVVSEKTAISSECREILKKIKKAKRMQIPMFRVFSSKLHKFEYIKRAKSYLHIKIRNHELHLLCKHPHYKVSREIEVVKLFPLKLTNTSFTNSNCYDMKLSLPSGLLVHTVSGINNGPLNIKQRYIEKGPQFKNIAHEDSRTFLRTGNVVVKDCDGTLNIYSSNGQIIRCEVPYSVVTSGMRYNLKRRSQFNLDLENYKEEKRSKLVKYQSRLQRMVNWRRRHVIDGVESRYFKFRRNYLRLQKLSNKFKIYILQKGCCKIPMEFTLVTHDGKKLKVTNSKIEVQQNIFECSHKDEDYEEYFRIRDDGTMSLMFGDGILSTQFPDKTRISSWFSDGFEMILREKEGSISGTASFSVAEDEEEEEEWILVQIFYKFEHPNYATVIFSSDSSEGEIGLPNDVFINITDDGNYFIDIDGIVSTVINKQIIYLESRACDTCLQRCVNIVNVQPLYDNMRFIPDNVELLRSCDSYEKVFIVNYNGKCYRNSNFMRHRLNRVDCNQHDREDFQKLFILNRDLSGCKLWDVKNYRNHVSEASDNINTIVQYYGKNSTPENYTSLEFRTFQYKPYYTQFLNKKYCQNFTLTSHVIKANPEAPICTRICTIHSMPKERMTEPLKRSLVECHQEHIKFPKSDDTNLLCKCTSQIARETSKIENKSRKEQKCKVSMTSALSLCERWYAWHENNQPYTLSPNDPICECNIDDKKELTEIKRKKSSIVSRIEQDLELELSVEYVPRKVSSASLEPYQPVSRAYKMCNIPAHFICDCKVKKKTASCEDDAHTNNSEETISKYDPKAMERILSIANLSYQSDFGRDVYITSEESSDSLSTCVGKSFSETVVQEIQQIKEAPSEQAPPTSRPPPCKCNIRKASSLEEVKRQPRKTCCMKHIYRKKQPPNVSLEEVPERQAGGEDYPSNQIVDLKESKAATSIQKRYHLKEIKRKILDLISVAISNKTDSYKTSITNDIFNKILQQYTDITEIVKLSKKLHNIDVKKYRDVSVSEVTYLIFNQEIPDLTNVKKGFDSESLLSDEQDSKIKIIKRTERPKEASYQKRVKEHNPTESIKNDRTIIATSKFKRKR